MPPTSPRSTYSQQTSKSQNFSLLKSFTLRMPFSFLSLFFLPVLHLCIFPRLQLLLTPFTLIKGGSLPLANKQFKWFLSPKTKPTHTISLPWQKSVPLSLFHQENFLAYMAKIFTLCDLVSSPLTMLLHVFICLISFVWKPPRHLYFTLRYLMNVHSAVVSDRGRAVQQHVLQWNEHKFWVWTQQLMPLLLDTGQLNHPRLTFLSTNIKNIQQSKTLLSPST